MNALWLKIKPTGFLLLTYGLVLIAGYLWFWALREGFEETRREWQHDYNRFSPIATFGLVVLPLLMLAFSVVTPIWCRRSGKRLLAFGAALAGFLFFIPWLIFIGNNLIFMHI